MTICNSAFDTHNELVIQRYKNGIRLVKPDSEDSFLRSGISFIFSLPLSSYFISANNQFINANDPCVELTGAQSHRDFISSNLATFVSKELFEKLESNNVAVMENERFSITEEFGERKDNVIMQALSFKFPWYYEDKVIGIFGSSIITPITSLNNFSQQLLQLVSTGLLSQDNYSAVVHANNVRSYHSYLTNRENEVLTHLLRGKTAKEIGRILDISYKTVENHLEKIRFKTDCKSRSELFDKFFQDN